MLSPAELIAAFKVKGLPALRARQLAQAVFKDGKSNYDEMTTLPLALREELKTEFPIFSIELAREQTSTNKEVTKALFQTKDGMKMESVLMRFKDGRHSVCVSSQVGCQLGCTFCATGTMKFGRNLTGEEIADQVLYFAQRLHPENIKISNIIYMGMGEPFMNYDHVLGSVKILNDPKGLQIGARNITLSTSGICEGIDKLAEEPLQVNLAVSLHAPNQELRQKIMPIARKYSLEQLMEAIHKYQKKTRRRVSYEYVMLRDVNDGEKEARELAALIKGQLCHVNLIPYNYTGIEGMKGSEKSTILRFSDIVAEAGVPVTVRVTLGQEIDAACGQLANKDKKG